jgi:hypothetical protein
MFYKVVGKQIFFTNSLDFEVVQVLIMLDKNLAVLKLLIRISSQGYSVSVIDRSWIEPFV